ncbi:MAG: cation transporter [Dechloromonas sp.]|nr:cation transporter [Dechloromonas sp.]
MVGRSFDAFVTPPATRQVDWASLIQAVARHLRIAHQIPGRIRFRIDPAVLADPALRGLGDSGLDDALGVIRGVRSVRLNRLARSCTIEYDRAVIPDHAWGDLLEQRPGPAAQILLDIIEDKYAEVRHVQP